MIPVINGNILCEHIGDEFFVFPDPSFEVDGVFIVSVNEIGYEVLQLINGTLSVADIAEIIFERYDAPKETIISDITDVINTFVNSRIVSYIEKGER